jgi:hypothetical protein
MKLGDSIFLDKSVAQKSAATFFTGIHHFHQVSKVFFLYAL